MTLRRRHVGSAPASRAWALGAAAASVVSAMLAPSAGAATEYWDGDGSGVVAGGTGAWTATGPRWGASPSAATYAAFAGGDAVFGGAGGYVSFDAAATATSLAFTGGAYTLLPPTTASGNTLTLTSGVVDTGAGDVRLLPFLGGTNGLTKNGAGTLYVTRASSYTGPTTINAGRLSLLHTTAGLPDATALTVAAGGSYQLGGPGSFYNDTIGALAGAGAVELSTALPQYGVTTGSALTAGGNNASTTFSGSIVGAGGRFRKAGTGTLTLTGVNTYTGFTDITAGTLSINGGSAIHDASTVFLAATGTVALNLNGASETIGGLSGGSASATVNLGAGDLTVGAAGHHLIYSGQLVGSGRVVKEGAGLQQFATASPGFTGGFTVKAGILTIASDGALGAVPTLGTGNNYITLDGGTLHTRGGATTIASSRGITLGAGGGTVLTSVDTAYDGVIAGAGALTKVGSNLLALSAEQTYTGGTNVNGGVLFSSLATTGATPGRPFGSGPLSVTGGRVELGASTAVPGADVNLAIGDGGAAPGAFSYGPGASLLLLKNVQNNSLSLTLGASGAAADQSLVRLSRGSLVITAQTAGLGGGESLKVNGGVTLTNGIVAPSIVQAAPDGAGDFVTSDVAGTLAAATGAYATGDINAASASSVFNVTAGSTLTANRSVYALRVGSGATLDAGGNVLTVGAGSGPATVILNGATVSNGTLNFGAAEGLIYSGVTAPAVVSAAITGSNGLHKFGQGELQVAAPGGWTGPTVIAGGKLTLAAGGSLPAGSDVTLYGSGILAVGGATQAIGTLSSTSSNAQVTLSAGGQLVVGAGSSTYMGAILGSGGEGTLVKDGTGTLTLGEVVSTTALASAVNSFGKMVVRGGGTVSVGSAANSLGAAPSSAMPDNITLDNGTLRFTTVTAASFIGGNPSATSPGNNRGVVLGAGGGTIEVTNPLEIILFGNTGNVFSGSGSLTKTGPGFLRLNTGNTYAGKTKVLGGVLQFGADSALGVPPGAGPSDDDHLFIDNDAVIQSNAAVNMSANRKVKIGAGGGRIRASTGSFTFNGVISGSGAVTLDGNNYAAFNAANTFTGPLILQAGTTEFRTSGSAGAGPLVFDPRYTVIAAKSNGTSDAVLNNDVTLGHGSPIEFRVDNPGTVGRLVLAGKVSGPAPFFKTSNGLGGSTNPGQGILQLSNGANDFTGAAVVQIGTLVASADNALGSTAGPTIVYAGGSLGFQGSIHYAAAEPVFVQGTGQGGQGAVVSLAGSNTFAGSVTLMADATLAAASGASLELTGVLHGGAGGSALTKGGAGTVRLAGASPNTNAGLTTVAAGTLELAKPNGVNALGGNVSVASGGTLLWQADEQIKNFATLTLATGGTVNLNGHTETVAAFVDSGGTTILGGGQLNVTGDIELADGSTIASPTSLTGGVVYTGVNAAATVSGDVTLTGASGSHALHINDGAANPDVVITGAISGSGHSITKTGAGTLRLSGNNIYSGGTTVTAGTLVTASAGAAGNGTLTVSAGGTLNVSANLIAGSISNGGNVTIDSGATVTFASAANSVTQSAGTLTVNGALSLAGHTFNYNGGSVTGSVTMGGSPTLNLAAGLTGGGTFNFNGSGGTINGPVPAGMTVNLHPVPGLSTIVNVGDGFTNAGTLALGSPGSESVRLRVGLGTGTMTNAGTFTLSAASGSPVRAVDGNFTNATGATANVNVSAIFRSIVNSGAFNIAPGATVTFGSAADTFTQSAGTLGIGGTLSLAGHTFSYTGGTIAGTVNMGGSPTLNIGAGAGGGTFTFNGSGGTITGDITTAMAVNVQPVAGLSTIINVGNAFTNAGTMTLSSPGTESVTLRANNGAGTITNHGTVTIQPGSGAGVRSIAGAFVNGATGVAAVNQSAVFGSIDNSGSFTIAAGKTVTFGSAGDTVTQSAGTLAIDGTLSLAGHAFHYNGGQVTGTVTMGGSPTLSLGAGAGGGAFLFNGAGGTIAGNVPPAMSISVQPTAGLSSIVNVGNAFTNAGAITLSSPGTESVSFRADNGTGTIVNAGTFTINAAAGGVRTVSGTFINGTGGVANVNATTDFATVANHGTLTVATGKQVTHNAAGSVFTQAEGALVIAPAAMLTTPGGGFTYAGGSIELASGSSAGGQLTLGGPLALVGTSPLSIVSTGAGAVPGSVSLGGTNRTITVSDVASGADLTISARVTGSGTLTKAGGGTLVLSGPWGFVSGNQLLVSAGDVQLNTTTTGAHSPRVLTVNAGGGNVSIGTSQTFATLHVSAGRSATVMPTGLAAPGAAKVIDLSNLNIVGSTDNWNGKLDLNDNVLVLNYPAATPGVLARTTNQIKRGLNLANGFWDGNGITSTAAANDPNRRRGLGVAEASDVLGISGSQTATFAGRSVDATTVLVMYTLYGDANLDGLVDFSDFARFDSGFATPGAAGWHNGDFTYDGAIDRDNDFALMIDSFYAQGTPMTPAIAEIVQRVQGVPEPGSAALLAAGAAMLTARRRAARRGGRNP